MATKKERLLATVAVLITSLAVVVVLALLLLETFGVIGGGSKKEEQPFTLELTAPEKLEKGQSSIWRVVAENSTNNDINVVVDILGKGVVTSKLNENDNSLNQLNQQEITGAHGETWAQVPGLVWQAGIIKKKEKKTLDFLGLPAIMAGQEGAVKVVAYEKKQTSRRCGFLWVKKCDIAIRKAEIASVSEVAIIGSPSSENRNLMTLYKGYNLVSVPIRVNSNLVARFFGQFLRPVAWHLDSATQTWINLAESAKYEQMAPGKGMWLYHPDGGDVLLPEGEAVSVERNFELALSSGWNQIGNPYQYRIKLDGDKILVKRGAGENITLAGAVEQGLISRILGVAGTKGSDTVADPSYIEIVVGRFVPAGAGLFINTTEPLTLVFPGKMIFAPGELISATEKVRILNWINSERLDVCGNTQSSLLGNNPLHNTVTGETLDQFDCVLLNHQERPWNN
ncbi:MAG TPA: hypothetical protein PLC05_02840 [bacterium]|nr:hypothetical protein [bacterium]HOR57635.1 hypothetical protein [bacterium]HPL56409.1 hypothetical protein [bacterium]